MKERDAEDGHKVTPVVVDMVGEAAQILEKRKGLRKKSYMGVTARRRRIECNNENKIMTVNMIGTPDFCPSCGEEL